MDGLLNGPTGHGVSQILCDRRFLVGESKGSKPFLKTMFSLMMNRKESIITPAWVVCVYRCVGLERGLLCPGVHPLSLSMLKANLCQQGL